MKIWLAITDREWFEHLRARQPEECNFWQPGGGQRFRAIGPGGLFLFKLHSPDNFVVGGGFFVRNAILPARLAWEAFGEKNGVSSLSALFERIAKYRRDGSAPNPEIGCNILTDPFFFERRDWIPVPASWKPTIVRGKTYDTGEPEGAELLRQVRARLDMRDRVEHGEPLEEEVSHGREGGEFLARARLGQGAFRVLVTDAYSRRCAVTGERTLPTLEAAHIRPYSEEGPNRVSNGLLLRSDWHRLFDEGYVTVTPDYRVEVSGRIREEYENGREYYRHHGDPLATMPTEAWQRPSQDFIEWHNERIFRG